MDLRTYAVSKRLSTGNTMIDYLLANKDIPAAVVEESFSAYLATQEDSVAETIISDQYLAEAERQTPLIVTKKDGVFEVKGDMPDMVADMICRLHNLGKQELIEALMSRYFAQTQNKEIEQTVVLDAKWDNRVFADAPVLQTESEAVYLESAASADETMSVESVEEMTETDQADAIMGEVLAMAEPDELEMTADIPEPTAAYSEPEEAVTEEEAAASEDREMGRNLRVIYDRFVEDLHRRGLVEKLSLVV